MLTVTNVEVVRALLWLGLHGMTIPDRVVAFALEEDFTQTAQPHPYAVACALLDAFEEASVLLAGERRHQSIYTPPVARKAPDENIRGEYPRGEDRRGEGVG